MTFTTRLKDPQRKKRLGRILKSDTITEYTLSDFDYVEEVLDFRKHKFVPLEQLLEIQIRNRKNKKRMGVKKYIRTLIRDIIRTFWQVMTEMMINDGYVLQMPVTYVKIGIGTVNRLHKNFRVDINKPNMGQKTFCRLIVDNPRKQNYPLYHISFTHENDKKIQQNVQEGRLYRTFNVD